MPVLGGHAIAWLLRAAAPRAEGGSAWDGFLELPRIHIAPRRRRRRGTQAAPLERRRLPLYPPCILGKFQIVHDAQCATQGSILGRGPQYSVVASSCVKSGNQGENVIVPSFHWHRPALDARADAQLAGAKQLAPCPKAPWPWPSRYHSLRRLPRPDILEEGWKVAELLGLAR